MRNDTTASKRTLSQSTLDVVLERGLAMTQSDPLGLTGSLGGLTSLFDAAVIDNLGGAGDAVFVAERGRFDAGCRSVEFTGRLGSGGGGSSRFSFCDATRLGGTTPPLSFALRMRVAKSGLLEVPGDRYMERRLVCMSGSSAS